ncbi:MAG: DEAD/DEAH box helicase [Acidobacteriota bacterium]
MSQLSFRSLDLHPSIQRGLREMEFEQPTPIQRDSLPPALAGHDVLACAATGSGKTAAFLLPILQRLVRKPRGTTRALILTPTRELAAQIVEHFEVLAKFTKVRAAAVYGGVGMNPQEQAFRKGVDVLVACPGRLLDHFNHPYAKLAGLEVLVLDEVDRMLDMGFLPDVRRVLRHLPKADQALFFSATLASPIARLARELLNDPVTLHVERASRPADGIEQVLWPVPEHLKRALLLEMIERGDVFDALVFTRTKHRANRLADFLVRRGVSCDRIHGNRSQSQRTRALANFKSGKIHVLVATDIAARGIDVTELSHVINFDPPHLSEDYIHRIGRTARAGATGEAFTFISPQDGANVQQIESAVGRRLPRRTLDGFDYGVEPPAQHRQQAPRAAAGEGSSRRPRRGQQSGAGPREQSGGQERGRRGSRPAQGKKQGQRSSAAAAGAAAQGESRPKRGRKPRRSEGAAASSQEHRRGQGAGESRKETSVHAHKAPPRGGRSKGQGPAGNQQKGGQAGEPKGRRRGSRTRRRRQAS